MKRVEIVRTYFPDDINDKILRYILRNGKKVKAQNVIQMFFIEHLNKRKFFVFHAPFGRAVGRLIPFCEVKVQRRGRKVTNVPYPIKRNRAFQLGIALFIKTLDKGPRQKSFASASLEVSFNKHVSSKKIRETQIAAIKNRRYVHFRWH
jgi:ribosomal protein S7